MKLFESKPRIELELAFTFKLIILFFIHFIYVLFILKYAQFAIVLMPFVD